MSTVKPTEPADQAAVQDFTQCPFWGQGGQFVFDPATGLRTRVGEPGADSAGAGSEPALVDQASAGLEPAPTETPIAGLESITTNIIKKEKARG